MLAAWEFLCGEALQRKSAGLGIVLPPVFPNPFNRAVTEAPSSSPTKIWIVIKQIRGIRFSVKDQDGAPAWSLRYFQNKVHWPEPHAMAFEAATPSVRPVSLFASVSRHKLLIVSPTRPCSVGVCAERLVNLCLLSRDPANNRGVSSTIRAERKGQCFEQSRIPFTNNPQSLLLDQPMRKSC